MPINIIGVTGPSGAGKSSLCRILRKKKVAFINADDVYHSLLIPKSECTTALAETFGEEILDERGAPDRKKLSAIVFSSEERLSRLNELVLHFVIDKINTTIAELEAKGEKNVVVDAPTLIESGFNRECDLVVSVLAPKEDRIDRICGRDGISREAAQKRVDAQHPDEFYIENSDLIITNDSAKNDFEVRASELFSAIIKK